MDRRADGRTEWVLLSHTEIVTQDVCGLLFCLRMAKDDFSTYRRNLPRDNTFSVFCIEGGSSGGLAGVSSHCSGAVAMTTRLVASSGKDGGIQGLEIRFRFLFQSQSSEIFFVLRLILPTSSESTGKT